MPSRLTCRVCAFERCSDLRSKRWRNTSILPDPNSFLASAKNQYGPIFTVNLGGKLMTFVTDPAAYPLITKAREGLSFTEVAAAVGEGVLAQDREWALDPNLDKEVHTQYAKFLTGASLDEITQRYSQLLHASADTSHSYDPPRRAIDATMAASA